jgi:predicted metalloendopeptidase
MYEKIHRIYTNVTGSQFDKDGNTNPWWSPETVKKFTDHAQCYIDMYGNFSVPELIPPLNETDAHVRLHYIWTTEIFT